ncbi:YkvA family protein [Ammoniphilus sp. YIM 78166]|uniref:YkvA family protein n=1 Tax=Ammoniphilus sp. YIM 78166 TaxID=1644106 RepID=UPI00106F74B6|nr:DUF1232 domain-containing protein [Ammoniphilus sp. YIM 78166]
MRKFFRRIRFLLNIRRSIPFLFGFFRSKEVPLGYKLLSGLLVLGYILIPFDLIPDFFLIFGLIDDMAVLAWVLQTIVKWAPASLRDKYQLKD